MLLKDKQLEGNLMVFLNKRNLMEFLHYFAKKIHEIQERNEEYFMILKLMVISMYFEQKILISLLYQMGNFSLDITKQLVQKQRADLLLDQIKSVVQNAERLKINNIQALKIANLTVVQAVARLNQNSLTSEEMLTALAFRTIDYGKKLNLFTYLYFIQALEIARKCDKERKEAKKRNITLQDISKLKNEEQRQKFLPCLFGIPISIKDVFHFQGRHATIGLIANSNQKYEESALIYCFRNAGMIPFVQTNVPMLGSTCETANNLWGRSCNPWNKERAVGGSSGGEAGMISARCSILGVGADIGGSVRIPSDHCGVFGLKTYSKRISSSYHAILSKANDGFSQVIPNSIGPLAKSAEDLALFMSVVTTQQFYKNQNDAYNRIVPFNSGQFLNIRNKKDKLRIGIMKSLKDMEPSPASQRALKQVSQILTQQGHQLIQISIPDEREVIRSFIAQLTCTASKIYRGMLQGQKPVKDYRSFFLVGQLRAPGRFIVGLISQMLMPRTYYYFFERKPLRGILEYQTHSGRFQQFRQNWIKYWREKKLDFVIAPGFGCQAFPHTKSETLGLACAYTFVWNALDMVAGALPVTIVRQDQQEYRSNHRDILTLQLKNVCKGSEGLPTGIQVIGLPYQEERVLGLMSMLQKRIKFNQKYGVPRID